MLLNHHRSVQLVAAVTNFRPCRMDIYVTPYRTYFQYSNDILGGKKTSKIIILYAPVRNKRLEYTDFIAIELCTVHTAV